MAELTDDNFVFVEVTKTFMMTKAHTPVPCTARFAAAKGVTHDL